ncbi:MAG: hypothetical protein JWN08_1058 [Frankiales bacterium]|nr:hypothetical protein [Frankiales bacterium]
MSSDRDALTTAVMELHAAVDGWAAGVVAAADAHPGAPERAVEEAGLGLAEDAFDDAFTAFHDAASRVLGLEDDEDDDLLEAEDSGEAVGVQLYATVVGVGTGDPVVLVDAASEQVVAALEAAGYDVPEWSVSIVPVQGVADPLDADDDTEDPA